MDHPRGISVSVEWQMRVYHVDGAPTFTRRLMYLDSCNNSLPLVLVLVLYLDLKTTKTDTMSVMLETSLGDLIIDLETERCPRTCENFLKLCKMKYYALNAFFNGTSSLDLVVELRVSDGGMIRWERMVGDYPRRSPGHRDIGRGLTEETVRQE
jgi:hypothetical protein